MQLRSIVITLKDVNEKVSNKTIGGFRGTHAPPYSGRFFNFIHFSEEMAKLLCWYLNLWGLAPPPLRATENKLNQCFDFILGLSTPFAVRNFTKLGVVLHSFTQS